MQTKVNMLGIEIPSDKKGDILEKIRKYIASSPSFCHIVSLNPENMVLTSELPMFKKVVNTAQIKTVDGVGIVLAGQILNQRIPPRIQGVDLMDKLMKIASDQRVKVMLIGGRGNLAEKLEDCYRARFPEAKVLGVRGIENIKRVKKLEEEELFSIVVDYKPRLVFVSFGSPHQELWIWKNRERFKGAVCMGVGGAFSFLTGSVPRAPKVLRKIGLEWFYRLILQPWRIGRQIRLVKFGFLVLRQKLGLL